MISLTKCLSCLLGKRGELRYGYILPAPKLSSSCRVLKYLSSCVLLLKFRLKSYSDLFRVSMDPRVKPEGDGKESVPEGDGRECVPEGDGRECVPEGDGRECVSEGDNSLLSSFRGGRRGQAIFKLGKNLTPLNLLLAKRRVIGIVLSLFFLFPTTSYSAICFLPDCHLNDEPISVGIDTQRCEDAGYVYYASGKCPDGYKQDTCIFHPNYLKCDGADWCLDNGYTLTSCTSPKTLSTPCPSNGLLYKYCDCPSNYKYNCTGNGYSSGKGTACDGKYTECNCTNNYEWNGSSCDCGSSFQYVCRGTGYSGGRGAACGEKYLSCDCSTYYSWNGSTCVHEHSYICPNGYKESNSGMLSPISTSKVCALSGCEAIYGECYKEGHSHNYSCPSGYDTSCSNAYSGTASKICSCGEISGTCYKCCSDDYKYACSGVGEAGSGASCGGKYKLCVCVSNYVSFCNVTFCS